MEAFFLVGVYHGDDLLNKRNCKFGKLSSYSCLYFHFFKKGIIKKKKKKSSPNINWRRRDGEGEGRRAGSQLFLYRMLLITVSECLNL